MQGPVNLIPAISKRVKEKGNKQGIVDTKQESKNSEVD
jgi:hypothetical protein